MPETKRKLRDGKIERCPHCGEDGGFFEEGRATYTSEIYSIREDGEPEYTGDTQYEDDHDSYGIYCRECGEEIKLKYENPDYFRAFQHTGHSVADLGEATNDDCLGGKRGRIYCGSLWIEEHEYGKRWSTIVDRSEVHSDSLDEIERFLANYAEDEGFPVPIPVPFPQYGCYFWVEYDRSGRQSLTGAAMLDDGTIERDSVTGEPNAYDVVLLDGVNLELVNKRLGTRFTANQFPGR